MSEDRFAYSRTFYGNESFWEVRDKSMRGFWVGEAKTREAAAGIAQRWALSFPDPTAKPLDADLAEGSPA